MWTCRFPPVCWAYTYCLVCATVKQWWTLSEFRYVGNCNPYVVFPGTGSMLPHGDAGPFPVSITGSSEGSARGSVLSGWSSRPSPRALCQCPFPKLWPWAPHRAGGSLSLMERCSWGMQPQPQDFSRSQHWKCGLSVWGEKKPGLLHFPEKCQQFMISIPNFLFPCFWLVACRGKLLCKRTQLIPRLISPPGPFQALLYTVRQRGE